MLRCTPKDDWCQQLVTLLQRSEDGRQFSRVQSKACCVYHACIPDNMVTHSTAPERQLEQACSSMMGQRSSVACLDGHTLEKGRAPMTVKPGALAAAKLRLLKPTCRSPSASSWAWAPLSSGTFLLREYLSDPSQRLTGLTGPCWQCRQQL